MFCLYEEESVIFDFSSESEYFVTWTDLIKKKMSLSHTANKATTTKNPYKHLIPTDVFKVCLILDFLKVYKVPNVVMIKPVFQKVVHVR